MHNIPTENICHFIPFRKDRYSLHIVTLVLETKPQIPDSLKNDSVYKIYYVCKGTGTLHLEHTHYALSEGDIFFTFPGTPFCIESISEFTYAYIGFLGERGQMILDTFKITPTNNQFSGCEEVYPVWEKGLQTCREMTDIYSEGILLYTLAYLGERLASTLFGDKAPDETILKMKQYIDENFQDTSFSLNKMASSLGYNPKYISRLFVSKMHIGISTYLNTIRIQYACTLMRQGARSINDIAFYCGYRDPQYFSRVFKKRMGVSPRNFMHSLSPSSDPQ